MGSGGGFGHPMRCLGVSRWSLRGIHGILAGCGGVVLGFPPMVFEDLGSLLWGGDGLWGLQGEFGVPVRCLGVSKGAFRGEY